MNTPADTPGPTPDPRAASALATEIVAGSETVILRTGWREPAEPPPALILCWHCGLIADDVAPAGWMTANPTTEAAVSYTYGVCPACLVAHYRNLDQTPPPRIWRRSGQ